MHFNKTTSTQAQMYSHFLLRRLYSYSVVSSRAVTSVAVCAVVAVVALANVNPPSRKKILLIFRGERRTMKM